MTGSMREPADFVFYTPTYLNRSENFLYHQITGVRSGTVAVVAENQAHREEFPVERLFLADTPPTGAQAWRARAKRRIGWTTSDVPHLEPHRAREVGRLLGEIRPRVAYCIFAWNAMKLHDAFKHMPTPPPLVFLAGGSDITQAEFKGARYIRKLRRVFQQAELILCGSEFLMARVLRLGAPEHKVRLHYIGVAIPAGEPRPATLSGGARLEMLAVSRLVEVKGVEFSIRAFKAASERLDDAHLTIVGEGPEMHDCVQLVSRLGLGDMVSFLGSQPLSTVYDLMARSDIFLQHNVPAANGQEESIGGSILEASAHGIPVVATRSGGVGEAVLDGETGFLVDPWDVQAMADRLIRLSSDPTLRRAMGAEGSRHVRSTFDVVRQNEVLDRTLAGVAGIAPAT